MRRGGLFLIMNYDSKIFNHLPQTSLGTPPFLRQAQEPGGDTIATI